MARGHHKRLKRIGLFIGLAALLILAGMVFIASKLGGDEEVMDDIDRHFGSLETTSSSYVAYYKAEERRGSRGDESGEATAVVEETVKREARGKRGGKPRRKKRAAGQSSSAPAFKGVRRVGPGTYLIDEALATSARKSPRSFIQGVRARLVPFNGKPFGFQLSGIGPQSPLHALGLRDGDVLLAVNGYQLKSIDEALLAATSCRFADKFRVDLQRGAGRMSLYYRVDAGES